MVTRLPLLFGKASGVPTDEFDLAALTFTARMALRASSPFSIAPVVQGHADGSGTPDVLSFPRGSQISGHFYANFDAYQGGVFLHWYPEFSTNEASGMHYLWYASADYYGAYDYDNDRFVLMAGGQSITRSVSITAGTRYQVFFRWDCNNVIQGSNYLAISTNDAHTYGGTVQPTASAPGATVYIGSNGSTGGGSGVFNGFSVMRRVAYDGAQGINAGRGDELNLHYAGGTGDDLCEDIGSWDVLFCMPTSFAAGQLSSGSGEAWSHPHGSNVLTDGFCETTYGSSAWGDEGTPSVGPADIGASDKIFNWGYTWRSSPADEGIKQSLSGLSAGANYVLRVIAHSADDIRISIDDDTNGGQLDGFPDYDFGAGSSRAAPGVAIVTFELPTNARQGVGSDCTAITIKIVGSVNNQDVYLHQIELLTNYFDNPSLEGPVADPYIPWAWSSWNLVAGDSSRDTADEHSGDACYELTGAAGDRGILQWITPANTFVSMGYWAQENVGSITTWWVLNRHRYQSNTAGALEAQSGAPWKLYPSVRVSSGADALYLRTIDGAATGHFDDAYCFDLDDVTVTVTPASEANSAESSGVRVDGYDTCVQTLALIQATSGSIKWVWRPRHADASALSFGHTTPFVASFIGAGSNYIQVYWAGLNQMRVAFNDGAGEHSALWNTGGAYFTPDGEYTFQVLYDATKMELIVDDVVRATINEPPNFANLPTAAYWGSTNAASNLNGDAVFKEPS